MEQAHGGQHVVDAARAAGVTSVFTLSGAHIFPVYDAAVGGRARVEAAPNRYAAGLGGPLRLVDTRHEQTAVFAAEATGRLTRTPGLAAVTAGPGVTNSVSGIATAWFNRTPMVVLGGRSPDSRWGQGALQELDQPPLVASITNAAWTTHDIALLRRDADRAFALAGGPPAGPVFWDVPIDVIYAQADRTAADENGGFPPAGVAPDPDHEMLSIAAARLDAARRPLLVLGSGVWMADAVDAARQLVGERNLPVIANGMGRGIIPAGDAHLVTRARSKAFAEADLVIVVGTPLDFRLGYGVFGDPPVPVVHITDDETSVSAAVTVLGNIRSSLESLTAGPAADESWVARLRDLARAASASDAADLASDAAPIHPARIYGELLPRLTADSVVIGDGGDFVSFAGRYIEPAQPGRWLDPGPYGCLGTGPGFALAAGIAHPQSPIVLLMGDGAAGFSLTDFDSLVRHRIPAVVIVANNSGWALERQPMRLLYGYDVIADLPPTHYDEIAIALGGGGETVTDPSAIGPAMDRAMAAGIPYLVNVMTDPEAAYPRSTLGI